MQRVKSLLVYHIGMSFGVLATPCLIQLPVNASWKAVNDSSLMPLPPILETWMKFQAYVFGMV